MALWLVALSGWLVALVALAVARRQASRVADLTAMHWELKHAHLELKARVDALAPGETPAPPRASASGTQFVPLSQVKR
ncbi:MAG: hypothetical protein ACLGHP_01350 [Vicinamibacteria bacterium]